MTDPVAGALERLSLLERDVRDHAKTVSVLVTEQGADRDRLVALERQYAVREEAMKSVDVRLAHIEGTLSKITWLIIGAIIAAAMTFIMNGGLRVPLG